MALIDLVEACSHMPFPSTQIASHLMPVLVQIAKCGRRVAFRYSSQGPTGMRRRGSTPSRPRCVGGGLSRCREVIISFMESKPKMMIKVPNYIEQAPRRGFSAGARMKAEHPL